MLYQKRTFNVKFSIGLKYKIIMDISRITYKVIIIIIYNIEYR